MGIAPALGNSIHLARLVEAEAHQFKSVLKTLAASIDARDELTSGHSEVVTEYALGICKEMGLPPDYQEMLRVASLLHDYGKIGVPDFILKKKGRLTDTERREIEKHVVKTKEILEQVSFTGIYKEVPEIAAAHHEKMDGSGYPNGLKGEKIPLGARIIGVADFFEAITSKRHYREPMNDSEALRLLMEGRGVHFDPKVVDAFVRFYTLTLNYNSQADGVQIRALPASIPSQFKEKGTLF
jgi:putative nucleotidyltransferase with HDIG domain